MIIGVLFGMLHIQIWLVTHKGSFKL